MDSVERRAVTVFAKNIFPASFRQKKSEFFESFRYRFDIPHCPMRFLILTLFFMQKYLEDPFAYCLAALATSWLTEAESFGNRNFFAG